MTKVSAATSATSGERTRLTTTQSKGTGVRAPGRARIAERTLRTDRWWLQPLLTVARAGGFIIYATVRAFVRTEYWVPDYQYLTPFYSPCLSTCCVAGLEPFGDWFGDCGVLPLAALSCCLSCSGSG